MLVVRVELWSAITGEKKEIARLDISNMGGCNNVCDYRGRIYRGRSKESLDNAMRKQSIQRQSLVEKYPRKSLHVWNLVARILSQARYK